MDPTFSQFRHLGPQAVPLYVENAVLRADRYWQVDDDELFARYFRADEYMELDFDIVRKAAESKAEEIVAYLRGNSR